MTIYYKQTKLSFLSNFLVFTFKIYNFYPKSLNFIVDYRGYCCTELLQAYIFSTVLHFFSQLQTRPLENRVGYLTGYYDLCSPPLTGIYTKGCTVISVGEIQSYIILPSTWFISCEIMVKNLSQLIYHKKYYLL